MPERTFTTHDIAKYCDVYPASVARWINDGKLRSYQTPGGHHRVTKDDLVGFLRQLNMRIPEELAGRRRVLIVDDDSEMARVIARAYSRLEDYEVETCGDGIEALIRIGQGAPDLLILDIILPKMDGVQVCRVLKSKAQTRNIKIIAITGKKLPLSEKRLADSKVDAIYRKPLDLEELLAMSAELLELKSLGRR